MNCVEVGELMQRNLDHDLDQNELQILNSHIANCDDCRVLYEKLSNLSAHLEQLPQVTPPFSLVDAILPKLSEIDKIHEVQASNFKDEEAVVKEDENNKVVAFYKKRWFTFTSGAVAAAVACIVTFTVVDRFNDNYQSYDVAMVTEQKDEAPSSGAEPQLERARTLVDGEEDASKETIEVLVIDQFGAAFTNNTSNEMPEEDPVFTDENSHSNEIMPTSQNQNPTTTSSNDDTTVTRTTEEEPTVVVTTSPHEPETGEPDEEFFVTTVYPHAEYLSPNEQFYLSIDEHMITVYDFATHNTVQTYEVPYDGSVSFIGWHEDSTEFYIEVEDKQFQTHQLTFVVNK